MASIELAYKPSDSLRYTKAYASSNCHHRDAGGHHVNGRHDFSCELHQKPWLH